MGPIGFSTGALAKGDFKLGVTLQHGSQINAVELSALRENELPSLAAGWKALNLDQFGYVSVHAPSKLAHSNDAEVLSGLHDLPGHWPVIAHPEILRDDDGWRQFGDRLCIENMDNRKGSGRTVEELRPLFERFPKAGFCLDLGHARQIDPTMATALRMLREFKSRLVQIHVSEVGPHGEHLPLSSLAVFEFGLIARHIPAHCPIIIESVVDASAIPRELAVSRNLFAMIDSETRSSIHAVAMAV